MHNIVIIYQYGPSQNILYGDKADAAESDYQKLKAALEAWKRFKNDTGEVVELDGSGMGKITIRVEHVMSASVVNYGADEEVQSAWAAYLGRVDRAQKIAVEGLK